MYSSEADLNLLGRSARNRTGTRKQDDAKKIVISTSKAGEKGLRPLGHRSVKWHFGVCLQQNAYARWGSG
jgi:hypothetical protein